jgi:hypothetical protein
VTAYREFLERKVCVAATHGFDVEAESVNQRLLPRTLWKPIRIRVKYVAEGETS